MQIFQQLLNLMKKIDVELITKQLKALGIKTATTEPKKVEKKKAKKKTIRRRRRMTRIDFPNRKEWNQIEKACSQSAFLPLIRKIRHSPSMTIDDATLRAFLASERIKTRKVFSYANMNNSLNTQLRNAKSRFRIAQVWSDTDPLVRHKITSIRYRYMERPKKFRPAPYVFDDLRELREVYITCKGCRKWFPIIQKLYNTQNKPLDTKSILDLFKDESMSDFRLATAIRSLNYHLWNKANKFRVLRVKADDQKSDGGLVYLWINPKSR